MDSQNSRRGAERLKAELGLRANRCFGRTQNISATGAFFEIDEGFSSGSEIELEIALHEAQAQRTLVMRCKGAVVRVEPRGMKQGVAVRFLESVLHFTQDDIETAWPASGALN